MSATIIEPDSIPGEPTVGAAADATDPQPDLGVLDVSALISHLQDDDDWPDPDILYEILAREGAAVGPLTEYLRQAPIDSPAAYNAVELLILLRDPAGLPAIVQFYRDSDDDIAESLSLSLPSFGAAALPYILALIGDRSLTWYQRAMAIDIVEDIAGDDPDRRRQAIDAVHAALAAYVADAAALKTLPPGEAEELVTTVSTLCGALADLAAEESRPLIQAAYDAGLVNPVIIGDNLSTEPFDRHREPYKTPDWIGWYSQEYRIHNEPRIGPPSPEFLEDWRRAQDFVRNMPYIAPPKPGRNDPCWCGSGKKYKKCHLNRPDDRFADL